MVTNRRILLIGLLLLALSGNALAQTSSIPKRLDSLQLYVLSQLNIKATGSRGIPLATVTRALNRGYSRTADLYPAIEKRAIVTITRSLEGAALPSDFNRLHQVFKKRGDTLRYPMIIIHPDSLAIVFTSLKDNVHSKKNIESGRYCWAFGDTLMIHPKYATPGSAVDTLVVHYFANPPSALSGAADTVIIHTRFTERLVFYACSQIAATRRDLQMANWYMSLFAAGLPPATRELVLSQ